MQLADYPGLYQASDAASKSAQKRYLMLMAADLLFMILAALLSIYNFKETDQKMWIYIVGSVSLVLGLLLTLAIKIFKFEDIWYQGRALAESVKSLTWKFVTCSEGFEITIPIETAKDQFVRRVEEVSTKFHDYTKHFDSRIVVLPTISSKMEKQRQESFERRKELYLNNRISDQKKWYSEKAAFNSKRHNVYFVLVIIAQALAIFSSYYLIKFPESNWNMVGLFTTIASVAIAWLQLKHHQELKQAYTTAAIELQFIEDKSHSVTSDAELARYVFDSENAISREHTLWLAQKRK